MVVDADLEDAPPDERELAAVMVVGAEQYRIGYWKGRRDALAFALNRRRDPMVLKGELRAARGVVVDLEGKAIRRSDERK